MATAVESELLLKFKKLLRSVLLPNKDGLLISALEDEYCGMTGESIPYKQLGYHSLLMLLESVPDLVHISRLANGVIMVRAVRDSSTNHIADMVSRQKDNHEGYNKKTWMAKERAYIRFDNNQNQRPRQTQPRYVNLSVNVPDSLKTKLVTLVTREKYGIKLSQLGAKYRISFKADIIPLDYGAVSIIELILAMSDLFEVIFNSHDPIVRMRTPKMEARMKKEEVELKEDRKVRVTNIKSPEEISIQNSECIKAVENISIRLQNKLEGEHPYLQQQRLEGHLHPKLNVENSYAAQIQGTWVRARVHRMVDSSTASLLLKDYNIVQTCPAMEIYLLPKCLDFSSIPPAVNTVSLTGVTRPQQAASWDSAIVRELKKIVFSCVQESDDQLLVSHIDLNAVHKPNLNISLFDDKGNSVNDILKEYIAKSTLEAMDKEKVIGVGRKIVAVKMPQEMPSDQIEKGAEFDFLASSSPKQNISKMNFPDNEIGIESDSDEGTLVAESIISKSSISNTKENRSEPEPSVQKIIFSNGLLTILLQDNALWCYASHLAQIIQRPLNVVMAVVRKTNIQVIAGELIPLYYLPDILLELDVEEDILISIVDQYKAYNSKK